MACGGSLRKGYLITLWVAKGLLTTSKLVWHSGKTDHGERNLMLLSWSYAEAIISYQNSFHLHRSAYRTVFHPPAKSRSHTHDQLSQNTGNTRP